MVVLPTPPFIFASEITMLVIDLSVLEGHIRHDAGNSAGVAKAGQAPANGAYASAPRTARYPTFGGRSRGVARKCAGVGNAKDLATLSHRYPPFATAPFGYPRHGGASQSELATMWRIMCKERF